MKVYYLLKMLKFYDKFLLEIGYLKNKKIGTNLKLKSKKLLVKI